MCRSGDGLTITMLPVERGKTRGKIDPTVAAPASCGGAHIAIGVMSNETQGDEVVAVEERGYSAGK